MLSSPFSHAYSTPSRSSYYSTCSNQPLTSSPLASPNFSSPINEAQERRRAQYKSKSSSQRPSLTPAAAKLLFRPVSQSIEDPQKSLLRGRLQARCREHAQKMRQQAINAQRSSDRCSDVFMDCDDRDDDEDETDDAILQDELFRRIVHSANHKRNHSYRISYAMEVGSSFDPDLEDAHAWESELRGKYRTEHASIVLYSYALAAPTSNDAEQIPCDMEEEELLEYAMLADFADIDPIEDSGTLSDIDDVPLDHNIPPQMFQLQKISRSSDMDVS